MKFKSKIGYLGEKNSLLPRKMTEKLTVEMDVKNPDRSSRSRTPYLFCQDELQFSINWPALAGPIYILSVVYTTNLGLKIGITQQKIDFLKLIFLAHLILFDQIQSNFQKDFAPHLTKTVPKCILHRKMTEQIAFEVRPKNRQKSAKIVFLKCIFWPDPKTSD